MKTTMKSVLLLFASLLPLVLAGCAIQSPLDLSAVDSSATPEQVRDDFENYRGRNVNWGGLVVSRNGVEEAQPLLEILSYPLRSPGNPAENNRPTGLFLFSYGGSQDLSSYQPGRFVTVVGEIAELVSGDGPGIPPLPMIKGDKAYIWGNTFNNDYSRADFGLGLGYRY